MAERIEAAVAAGTAPDDIAVLCRTKALMAPLAAALSRRAIPWQGMHVQAFRRFDWQPPAVKLVTLHSARRFSAGA